MLRSLLPSKRSPRTPDTEVRARGVRRSRFIGGIISVCYVGLTLQAARIMLTPDSQLESKARIQFEQAIEVQGRRGDILARDGSILATTAELYAVHVDPSRAAVNPDAVAAALGPLLDLEVEAISERLERRRTKKDILLKRGLTPQQGDAVRAAMRELIQSDRALQGAIWLDAEQRRFYTGRSHAAPVIGLVGHSGTGVAGLERTMDRTLRGEIHKYVQLRDRKGRRVTADAPTASAGDAIVLTLDRRLQHVAEEALQKAMVETGAESAWAVAMDVETGEILVLANRPTQNPNDTTQLRMDSFKNHAALDAYEPGSVFKPFIAAAALEEGLYRPESFINCENGAWLVGRRVIHDDHPKGVITVSEVIKYSSNIGAAKMAFKLGAERTLSYLKQLGFGRYSGLDLPGETRGVVRRASDIKPIELATTSYGHGVSVNAIQLVSALATLGNEGVRMKPLLVREIRDEHGNVLESFLPEAEARVFSPETTRATLEMMVTVTERGGTGTRAQVPGYTVAGKTGTAWKHENGGYSSTDRIGSFLGLIPAEDPKLAIIVTVDTPTIGLSYGGVVAAPAFATIAAEAMRLYGIPPNPLLEAEEDTDVADARPAALDVPMPPETSPELVWNTGGTLRVPDLTGLSLRDALATVVGAGLQVSMTGSGRITEQHPAPGAALSPGDAMKVVLQ
jgi:cell division protein FtsI (penicillin-binding protein 3)